MRPVDVSVVVTGHHEGDGCAPTFAALARALDAAVAAGVAVEVVGVLDRADEATIAAFDRALGDGGVMGRLVPGRRITTDHGDPGAARNDGVRHSRGAWVCVLDADNLPSRTWLRDAYAVATRHRAPCVVHPEHLLIFGDRWQLWPQLPSDHPGFRVHNFFDRTYWDTFCLASREVFSRVPYVPTSALRGLGPEDWHWGMETVHAGVAHLAAPGTTLLYRSKPSGSVQGGHVEARSLLPPTDLLTDPGLAASLPPEPRHDVEWRGLQGAIARHHLGELDLPVRRLRRAAEEAAGRPLTPAEAALVADPSFNVLHYRALNPEPLRLTRAEAVLHYVGVGHAAGLRARLSEAEVEDVLDLDLHAYRVVNPDLAGLGDNDLLHHYLVHGSAERRPTAVSAEQRQASEPVALDDDLVAELRALGELEPDFPVDRLPSLRRTGPPADGSTTPGSRVWWQAVSRLGGSLPQVLVFVDALSPQVADLVAGQRAVVVATGDRPSSSPELPVPVVDLAEVREWRRLPDADRHRLLATLVVQCRAERVHVLGSADFAAALDVYGRTLRSVTTVVDGSA